MADRSPREEQVHRAARIRGRIRKPPAHRALLVFCLLIMVLLLGAQGLTVHATGQSRTPGHGTARSLGSVPLLTLGDGRLSGVGKPTGRRVALTFDDGPDPKWTPRIA